MNILTVAASALLAVTAPVPQAPTADLGGVVRPYLDIQQKLAADSTDGVSADAAAIVTAAGTIGPQGDAIAKAATRLEHSKNLGAMRSAFGDLSEAVLAAAKASGWSGLDDVKVAYCPMAKHNWLQKGDEVRNPYYGNAMPSCGSFKDR